MSSGNLLHTALDHRAAAYEKLGQLQSALKDAKHMIELKPELAKVGVTLRVCHSCITDVLGIPSLRQGSTA